MAFGHGKVILFGEHAVVFGHPAVAVAIENAAEVSWERATGPITRLTIQPGDTRVDTGSEPNAGRELLQRALKVARALYADDLELELRAHMTIPTGAGLGSSAALGVAVLRAMDEARGLSRDDAEIFERSFEWERVFHGTPGGIDNAMATYGGLQLFKRAFPLKEGVPIYQQISLTRIVPRDPFCLVVANSGNRPPAIQMITGVRELRERNRTLVDTTFDGIAALVPNGKLAIEQGELKSLGQLMDMNHMSLAGLMLVSSQVQDMVGAARQAGALGAKMTGAGGGGCMIALVNERERADVLAALAAYQPFEAWVR
ncbi:MAG TPA: mevalonate kinase [Polyangiales bacterium]